MIRLNLRKRKRVCYYEPEEPPFDEYVFCTECRDYVYEYCSIHGPLLVIPDDKVPSPTGYPPLVPRAALTIPRAFLHLAVSRIPDAGIGVFSSMTLPIGVRFGPYCGTRLPPGPGSYYGWQIVDANHKPSHMIDALDANHSNWMRYVNCSRHHSEQNLVAYQYQGQLYYRTVKVIPRFTELLVFYGSGFARQLGVDLRAYRARCVCDYCQAQQPEKSAPVKTRKRQIQNEEKPKEENIAKRNPVDTIQDTQIDPVDTQKNGDSKIARNVIKPIFNRPKPINKTNDFVPPRNIVFKCDKCNESFDMKTDLEKHVHTHAVSEINKISDDIPKTKLKCNKCDESFDLQTDLEKHLRTHVLVQMSNKLAGKKFTCKSCSTTFETKICLSEHMKSQHNVEYLACTEQTVNSSNLKQHLMSVHAGLKPFKCSHCSFTSSWKCHLVTHERTHTGEKPYKCDICDYMSARSSLLKQHIMSVHAGVKPFKCSHCSYTCCQKSNLVRHERTHTGEKPYKCDICDYMSARSSLLKQHIMSVHAGVKPFKCSHCSYTCSRKNNLVTHERTHTGEKPYKCDICDYKTAQSSHLKQHLMSVHAGVKPFKCSHCSYTCCQKSYLVRHERTHTGEKPYKCDICDYKAARSSDLKQHIMSVHAGVKPFKCSHCSYTCCQKSNLVRHERTHTGEKPYKCDICEYKAARSSHLKQHLKKIHSEEKPYSCNT